MKRPSNLSSIVMQSAKYAADETGASSTSYKFSSVLKISEQTNQKEIDEHDRAYGCKFSYKYYYCSEDLIGEGCAATVYHCCDKMTGEKYVVKITISDDQAKLNAAIHEFKIMSLIPNHGGIVRGIDQYVSEERNIVHTVLEHAGE